MSRSSNKPKIKTSWQIEIIRNEVESYNETLSNPDWYDPNEKELLIDYRNNLQQWLDELDGRSSEKTTPDEIDWRCHVLENDIIAFSQILEQEDTLDKREHEAIIEDIKKLKIWKSEIRKRKRSKDSKKV